MATVPLTVRGAEILAVAQARDLDGRHCVERGMVTLREDGSDLVVVTGRGIKKSSRYVVRVTKDGEALARQTGLIDNRGRPVALAQPVLAPQRRGRVPRRLQPGVELALGRVARAAHGHVEPGAHHPLHRHLVARERAGLVGADHGRRAERLDGGQAPHEGVAPRHPLDAQGQSERDRREQ